MKLRSILISSAGTIIPAFIFIFLYPLLVSAFGISRFGYISLALILLSISSIFDMGLSRGATYFVAKRREDRRSGLEIVWGLFNFSIIISTFVAGLAYVLLYLYFSSSPEIIKSGLSRELLAGLPFLAMTIPIVIAHAVIKGILEGFELFHIVSGTKISTALITAALLVGITYLDTKDLVWVAKALFMSRVIGFIIISVFAFSLIPYRCRLFIKDCQSLLRFSGWASISNLSSTFLNYTDRFVAGYFLPSNIYGIYSAMSDVIMRFLFIPGAVCTVLYPNVAKTGIAGLGKSLAKCTVIILLTIIPISLVVNVTGKIFFEYWLSVDLTDTKYSFIIYCLTAGLVIASFAQIPYAVIQGLGKSYLTARIHMLEVIIFVPLVGYGAFQYGLEGILSAWLLRIAIDCILLFSIQMRVMKIV